MTNVTAIRHVSDFFTFIFNRIIDSANEVFACRAIRNASCHAKSAKKTGDKQVSSTIGKPSK